MTKTYVGYSSCAGFVRQAVAVQMLRIYERCKARTLAARSRREALAEQQRRACRVCGCTEYAACSGGCWWVAWDLCSQCEGKT